MPVDDDDALLLLLMVKDEEGGIARPIRSAAAIGVREVFLVDTGSTDDTRGAAIALCTETGVSLVTDEIVWPDSFADARNACLARARALFPGRHVLFLDADDEVTGTWRGPLAPVGTVQLRMGTDSWVMPRVLPLTEPLPRYRGVVHEIVDTSPFAVCETGLVVRHHAGKPSTERWKRDERLLWADYAETGSPRSLFYLAQTIECLAGKDAARQQLAAHLYAARGARDNTEEAFVALLRAAGIRERFPLSGDSAEAVLEARLLAHERFPDRPEPLVDAAWAMLRADRWASAYAFAKMGQQCAPREGALFLRRTARWNETYDILSRACLRLPGKIEEGLALTLLAAKNIVGAPFDWPRQNLAIYRKRMGFADPFPEENVTAAPRCCPKET